MEPRAAIQSPPITKECFWIYIYSWKALCIWRADNRRYFSLSKLVLMRIFRWLITTRSYLKRTIPVFQIFCLTVAGPAGDLHVFDPETLLWNDLSSAYGNVPPSRSSCGLVAVNDRLILFGGMQSSGRFHL